VTIIHDLRDPIRTAVAEVLRPRPEDLLRIRYCPARWDFGMRYLERDLPVAVHLRFCGLLFVRDLADLEARLEQAGAWGAELLAELTASE
jgi:hypothetical protein